MVLDKPSGLLTHADGRNKEESLTDWIAQNYPELEDIGEQERLQNGEIIKRYGLIHRLDRETSGVILVAKTEKSFLFLKKQFQDRLVEKTYHAVVWGALKEREGIVEKPIGRSATDFRKWSAESGAKGELREAVTEYKVLVQNEEWAYLEVKPKTGRTHQIRVHLKSINHPVVCDKLYAPKRSCVLGFDRLALHASSIRFKLPNGTDLEVESPLPEEFEKAKEKLHKD